MDRLLTNLHACHEANPLPSPAHQKVKLISWLLLLIRSSRLCSTGKYRDSRCHPPRHRPQATATLTPTFTPTFTPVPTKTPLPCGRSSPLFILLVGSDSRQDTYKIGLSDSMRVIRVDFTEPRVQVMTFPRDLYVEIPEIEDHYGITHGKLNQAYLYGNPGYGYYDGPGRGTGFAVPDAGTEFWQPCRSLCGGEYPDVRQHHRRAGRDRYRSAV